MQLLMEFNPASLQDVCWSCHFQDLQIAGGAGFTPNIECLRIPIISFFVEFRYSKANPKTAHVVYETSQHFHTPTLWIKLVLPHPPTNKIQPKQVVCCGNVLVRLFQVIIYRDPWRATFTNGAYLATSQTSPWKKATKCETNTFALKHCCVYYNPHITG